MKPFTEFRSEVIGKGIENNIEELIFNIHGSHVLQICLLNLTKENHLVNIFNKVNSIYLHACKDKHGCCVI